MTATSVDGSMGLTSKSMLRINRDAPAATNQAGARAGARQCHRATKHHVSQISRSRPEGDSNAELARLLVDRGCGYAVEADRREE